MIDIVRLLIAAFKTMFVCALAYALAQCNLALADDEIGPDTVLILTCKQVDITSYVTDTGVIVPACGYVDESGWHTSVDAVSLKSLQAAASFDVSTLDPVQLGEAFSSGFGMMLAVWAAAKGVEIILKMLK